MVTLDASYKGTYMATDRIAGMSAATRRRGCAMACSGLSARGRQLRSTFAHVSSRLFG